MGQPAVPGPHCQDFEGPLVADLCSPHFRGDGCAKIRAVELFSVCGCSSVDRVLASEAKGRGFDPRQPHQSTVPSVPVSRCAKAPLCAGHRFAPLWLSWHRGIGQAFGWSEACGQLCGVCPRPPLFFAATRHQPCALVCPSTPQKYSLNPCALAVDFCYKFSSCSRTEYMGYRPKRPVSQRGHWLTSAR